ncbi:MAG TPA: hypothetical protein VLA98_05435, partial [Solirubrobacteraceae bacterium]|nr:hypothetical protein [Solirubrobacteraceae bacterium]
PRCPYVRESHKRIDPQLAPTAEGDGHEVACLLPQQTRRALWQQLHTGATPDEAKGQVAIPEEVLDQEVAT